jgi:integrase
MAARLAKRALLTGAVPETSAETCDEYFDRWVRERERRGLRSTSSDCARWKKWISPHFGAKPIAAVTTRDLETFVASLDDAVRRSKLSWKTAVHVWGLVTKMMDDARRSKDLSLRVRSDNPAREVRGPDRGHDKASAFLFPTEITMLLECVAVPLFRRRIYALAVYLGPRAGEIRALEWPDIHTEQGFIDVQRAVDYDTGKIKTTKTGRGRRVPIEPELLPLLEAMREEAGGEGPVFARMPHRSELPWMLRLDLKEAGVIRAELHEDTTTSRKLDFHDLRHTYATLRAIRGDDVVKIKFAMGHTDIATTMRYVNEAQSFEGARFGTPFGPLPLALFANRRNSVEKSAKHTESLRPQGDSKARQPLGSSRENPRENKLPERVKPSDQAEQAQPKPSVETLPVELAEVDIERAIVAAMLDGRGAVAEMLAEGLKERRHTRAGNVVTLAERSR